MLMEAVYCSVQQEKPFNAQFWSAMQRCRIRMHTPWRGGRGFWETISSLKLAIAWRVAHWNWVLLTWLKIRELFLLFYLKIVDIYGCQKLELSDSSQLRLRKNIPNKFVHGYRRGWENVGDWGACAQPLTCQWVLFSRALRPRCVCSLWTTPSPNDFWPACTILSNFCFGGTGRCPIFFHFYFFAFPDSYHSEYFSVSGQFFFHTPKNISSTSPPCRLYTQRWVSKARQNATKHSHFFFLTQCTKLQGGYLLESLVVRTADDSSSSSTSGWEIHVGEFEIGVFHRGDKDSAQLKKWKVVRVTVVWSIRCGVSKSLQKEIREKCHKTPDEKRESGRFAPLLDDCAHAR